MSGPVGLLSVIQDIPYHHPISVSNNHRLEKDCVQIILTNFAISLLPFSYPLISKNFSIPSLFPVMSGNSADSYSEGESEGEQVKEKPEVPTTVAPAPNPTPTLLYVRKGKNNGRVGRPKKLKNTQPPPLPPPPPPANRRRGSGQPKSGLFGISLRG